MKHIVKPRSPVFSKTFRWHPPQGHAVTKVEVAGTFTGWKRLPLSRQVTGDWQLALHEIASHRTHHYMLFADDQPVSDKHSDGLAVPHGPDEEKSAMITARGPRVFMLFAQTK